jgi:hypothetical protein
MKWASRAGLSPERMPDIAAPSAVSDESRPRAFFESMERAFGRARDQAGLASERCYSIAGFRVRVCIAGPALAPFLTRALEPLETSPAPVIDLEICCWDGASSGAAPGDLPGGSLPNPHWTYRGRRFEAMPYHWHEGLSMVDFQTNRAFLWVADPKAVDLFEMAQPLRALFHMWLSRQGVELIHAAAVGRSGKGLLLVGKNGAGKSTAAMAAVNAGLSFLADDVCLLRNGPAPRVYRLYSSLKLHPERIRCFPFLKEHAGKALLMDSGKSVFFMQDCFPRLLADEIEVQSVMLLQLSGTAATAVQPISPMRALRAFAPSTVFQIPSSTQSSFQNAAELVGRVPCLLLEAGSDLDRLSEGLASRLPR